jgi:hypothetical protein
MYCSGIDTPIGNITAFGFLITHIGRDGWNITHLDVVFALWYAKMDNKDINMTLPEGCPEGRSTPKIIYRLSKALYGITAQWEWCLSILSSVCTVLHQSQYLPRCEWYSATSVWPQYLLSHICRLSSMLLSMSRQYTERNTVSPTSVPYVNSSVSRFTIVIQ